MPGDTTRAALSALRTGSRWWAVVLGLLAFGTASAHPEDWGQLLREDRAAARPWPLLSTFEPALSDTPYAYAVQRSLAGPDVPWIAWRSLFVSPALAQQFRVSASAYARLGQQRQFLHPPYVLRHAAWQRPVVELGLAARLSALPARFPVSPAALEPLILGWSAMVVIADLGFAAGPTPRLGDYIAVNGGGEAFMTGPLLRGPGLDLQTLRVNLSLAGRQLAWGRGDELPGGPLQSLAQLLNTLAQSRESLNADQLFFTGALGRAVSLAPGRYVADFGSLGKVEFESRRVTTRPPVVP